MSLNKLLLKACPLLLETDMLSLSSSYQLRGTSLLDGPLHVVHELTPTGSTMVALLQRTISYQELSTVSAQQHIDESSLRELLGLLNRIGGLQRTRAQRARLIAFRTYCLHLAIGIYYAPISYRRLATILTISIGTLRATTPVILATGVVAGLIQAAGFASVTYTYLAAAYLLLVFLLSIIAHELAHVFVLRYGGICPQVLQSGMHLGVIHRRASAHTEISSSLAGPLAGIAICLSFAGLSWLWQAKLLGCAASLIALLHISSLTPFYGDGASLQKALQERK